MRVERGRWWVAEGFLLLTATPLLLFPTVWPTGAWLAAGALAAMWLAEWLAWREPWLTPAPLNLPLTLWLVMLAVGTVVSADPDLTWPKAAGIWLGLAVYRYTARVVRTPRQLGWGLLALGGLGAVLLAVGFFSADWAFEVGFVRSLFGRLPPRLFTLPESPAGGVHTNQLGGTVAMYLPLVVVALLAWRPARWAGWTRAVLVVLLTGLTALLILTQSRSAWLAGAGSLVAMGALWATSLPPSAARRRLMLLFGAGVLLSAGVALAVGPERWQQVWQEPPRATAIGTLSTLAFRQEVWRWATTAIYDFPFTGVGLGAFRQVVHRLYPIAIGDYYDIAHAHDIFLQVALDSGLPGLIAYLALVGTAVGLGWSAARRSATQRIWAIGLTTSLITFHLYGLIDALAPGSKTSLSLWLIWGLIAALPRITASSPPELPAQEL